jgi:hypothetical protein
MDYQFRYVYYDKKTSKILSISTKDDSYEHGIKVPFDEVHDLLTGKASFRDYVVGHKKTADGKTKLGLILNSDQGYNFKNNVFEWITEQAKSQECIVTWNGIDKVWEFSVSNNIVEAYADMSPQKLVFFVTLEHDFDFLVRTILISSEELIASKQIVVPFKTNIEHKIDKISISSKIVFKSYGLRIVNE